jgi:hypothetical protein
MTLQELAKSLREQNIDPRSYSLGVDKNESLCLVNEGSKWCVYYSERGLQSGRQCFEDESAACKRMLDALVADPTAKIGWKSGFSM